MGSAQDQEAAKALFTATGNGNFNEVKRLLKSGVSPNSPDPFGHGMTPLAIAVMCGNPADAYLLLKFGANREASTPRGSIEELAQGHGDVFEVLRAFPDAPAWLSGFDFT